VSCPSFSNAIEPRETQAGGDCLFDLAALPPQRGPHEGKRIKRRILDAPISKVLLRELTADHIEQALRNMEADGLSAATVNGLRGTLNTIFRKARKAKRWLGENPITDVEPRSVPQQIRATLKAEEV
jgi:hypothetical protein